MVKEFNCGIYDYIIATEETKPGLERGGEDGKGKAMRQFLVSRQLFPHGPLFTLSCGAFLTRSETSKTTKSLLRAAGFDPDPYSSHSYRIGAATAAAEAGLPEHMIKTLGRWRSSAYQTYIRSSPNALLKAAKQITQAQ